MLEDKIHINLPADEAEAEVGFEALVDCVAELWEERVRSTALSVMAITTEACGGVLIRSEGLRVANAVIAEMVAIAGGRGLNLERLMIEREVLRALD